MNRLSSRRSQTVELNSNANLKNYEGLNEPQETQELKVCNDCQIRYSHKSSSYSDPGVGKYQPNKLKKTLENDNVLRNSSAISREVPLISPMEDIDLNTKDIQGDSTKSSHSSKVRSSQRFSKERLDSSFDKTNKNRQSNYIKVGDLIDSEYESHRHQINTEKGYIKRVGDALGSLKNKFPIGIQETEYKINQTSSQEDIGEERFIKYAEEFSADLDKVTQRFESNLKKNFENTAHNILHQHLNNQSLLENDDIYKNRESKYLSQRGSSKYSSHNPTKSQRNSGDFSKEHDNHMEYSYISDTQQKKNGTIDTPSKQEYTLSTLPVGSKKWESVLSPKDTNDKLSQNVSQDLPINLYESKTSKGFRSIKNSLYESGGIINQNDLDIPEQNINYRDLISIHDEKKGNNLRLANERLKSQAKSRLKTERKLISPPNHDKIKYENETNEINTEEKIAKLEEIAIHLMKENHHQEALECLIESENVIRNELAADHPQHLYIYYLLGECYIKQENLTQANQILERAIKRYENGSTEYEKESPYFYYYLGFLVLEAHICMLTKSYDRALKIYNKLLKGTNNCKKDQKAQQLIGIIPHTLLIKYNMGECYRNIGKSNESDELFFDVVRNFNFYDQELLENSSILFNIASYFQERKIEDLALETLYKVCDLRKYDENMEMADPTILMSAYDDISGILFNKQNYSESAKYSEISFNLKVKWYGMKHSKVGYSLLALGKTYQMAGESTKALQRLASGLEVLESIEGRSTFYSANTSFTMAKIHFSLKEYLRAIYLYERSLEIYSHLLGPGHPYCFRVYANLVYVCFESKSRDKVVEVAEKLTKATQEANSSEVFGVLNEIGNIFRKYDFPEIAFNLYNVALKKAEEYDHTEIPLVSIYLVYINMGSACFYLKKYGDALHYYKEAAKYFSEINAGANPEIVLIYVNVVRVYKALGKSSEASLYIKKASTILTMIEKDAANQNHIQKLKSDLKILRNNSK